MAQDIRVIPFNQDEIGSLIYALEHAHADSTSLRGQDPATAESVYSPLITRLRYFAEQAEEEDK